MLYAVLTQREGQATPRRAGERDPQAFADPEPDQSQSDSVLCLVFRAVYRRQRQNAGLAFFILALTLEIISFIYMSFLILSGSFVTRYVKTKKKLAKIGNSLIGLVFVGFAARGDAAVVIVGAGTGPAL
jgi:leucine efflux protein